MLAADAAVVDTVIPNLIAFKAIMNIRNIQLTKQEEQRKLKEKADREGADMKTYKENPRYQTEEEKFCIQLDA